MAKRKENKGEWYPKKELNEVVEPPITRVLNKQKQNESDDNKNHDAVILKL